MDPRRKNKLTGPSGLIIVALPDFVLIVVTPRILIPVQHVQSQLV